MRSLRKWIGRQHLIAECESAGGAHHGPPPKKLVADANQLRRRRNWLAASVCLAGLTPLGIAAKLHIDQFKLNIVQEQSVQQRALVQHAALSLHALTLSSNDYPDERIRLRAALTARLSALSAITDSMLQGGDVPPASSTAELRAVYRGALGLEARLPEFISTVSTLAERESPPTLSELRAIESSAETMLPALQAATAAHAKAEQTREQWIMGLLLTGCLLPLTIWLSGSQLWIHPLHHQMLGVKSRIEREAQTDPLTGLLNRRAFMQQLESLLQGAIRGRYLGIIVLDLDWFKEINTTDGHAGGDAVLVEVGHRLRQIVRRDDLVARMGGDEFALAVPHLADSEQLSAIAARIRDVLSAPVHYQGKLLRLGASVGAVIAPPTNKQHDDDKSWRSSTALLRYADEALAEAKRSGRGQWKLFCEEDQQRSERASTILRSFTAQHDRIPGLRSYLQPVIDLKDGHVLGFEALARWDHPELGALSPAEFLPVVENAGKANVLGSLLRMRALSAFSSLAMTRNLNWQGKPWVAINISPADLASDLFLRDLQLAISDVGLSMPNLVIEITEDVLLDRVSEDARERLIMLRGHGAKIVLDDFGTGYSGLKQLMSMPLDGIKLDKSFTRGLGSDARATGIVRATLGLAHSLDLRVTAEGVESEDVLLRLRDMGCDAAQGYLVGRPASLVHVAEWCHQWSQRSPRLFANDRRQDAQVIRLPLREPGVS